jgi:hypothetical protein
VRVFQRFRLWLSSIYTAAKAVPGSDIDPEISGVFDRCSRPTARSRIRQGRGVRLALFSTPAEAGMSPQQFRDYLESQPKRALSHAAEVANVRT